MRQILVGTVLMTMLFCCLPVDAQEAAEVNTNTVVPTLVNYSGTLTNLNGKPLTSITGVTFLLYKDEQGGAPLWMETQNVTPDKSGHYTAVLGSTSAQGLPTDLFASGEARWLAVQPEGQAEPPRVLLLSVPYALKAGDAQTIGGLPASAFMLANGARESGNTASSKSFPPTNPDVTGKGTAGYIPTWDTTSDIINSPIFEKTGAIGIGTTTPAATLDVNGKSDVRDTLTLFPKSTDNPLAISGTTFKISSTGAVTFISGQTFPGAGTITGITTSSSSGLSGGGTKGTLNLSVKPAGVTNAMLQNSKVTLNANSAGGLTTPGAMTLGSTYTVGLKPCAASQVLAYSGSVWNCSSAGTGTITGVTAGSDLTGGGTSGKVTLNLDTTKVPLLASGNIFTAGQTINATGSSDGLDVNAVGGNGITSIATSGTGVLSSSTNSTGVSGITAGNSAYGVYGENLASGGTAIYGETAGGTAVYANATGSGGTGIIANGSGIGIIASGAGAGIIAGSTNGSGLQGTGLNGVWGESYVCCTGSGGLFYGYTAQSGSNNNGTDGVLANGGNADPASTYGTFGGYGVVGTGGNGTAANSFGGIGVVGYGGTGTEADAAGGSFFGGYSTYYGDGLDAYEGSSGYAGQFSGNVYISGTMTAAVKNFKIDHPLDPANKYLVHASIESSEMMNIYSGNVTTDAQASATVQLPEWFEVVNSDFRYQLTVVGQFAQAIVARKIENHQFEIRTSVPNVEVSWQVTGVRQDPYAKVHPLIVEEEKEARLKGFYIHPDLYGAPAEKQIEWARHPEMMKRAKDHRSVARPAVTPVALPAPPPPPAISAAMQQALKARK